MSTETRLPHAIKDAASRLNKARKIERLVGDERLRDARNILEAGTGSGYIANYLSRQYHTAEVTATDVTDVRVVHDGYTFVLVDGPDLPFPDRHFDVVVSNHVLEHVGDRGAQLRHLNELRRVLHPDGIIYFAIPNRWSPYEAHFRLPFLSWLPPRLRTPYVRLLRRGTHYDCEPRGMFELRALLAEAEFEFEDVTLSALRTMLELEKFPGLPRWAARALSASAIPLFPLIPTYAFLLRRPLT